MVLGRHRVFPPYAAQPYTEIDGDDQYWRAMFLIGYGPVELEELKIGETPIEDFPASRSRSVRGLRAIRPAPCSPTMCSRKGCRSS